MNPFNALGPDGFSIAFFQKNWFTVGVKVTTFALDVLNNNGCIDHINDTYITLILKVHKATRVGEFRPISLYNVIYKIVAKAIANRLKPLIFDIISPTQSAFIPIGKFLIT